MATKKSLLDCYSESFSDTLYRNLNVNRLNKCSKADFEKCDFYRKNIFSSKDYSDSSFGNDRKRESSKCSWKTSGNKMKSGLEEMLEKSFKTNYKELDSKSGTSGSTLSLHIACYENSISSSSDSSLEDASFKSQKKFKERFMVFENDGLEFARQQTDDNRTPEIMQFKSSQKLLDPVQESVYLTFTPEQKLFFDNYFLKQNEEKNNEIAQVKHQLEKERKQHLTDLELQKEKEEGRTQDLQAQLDQMAQKVATMQMSAEETVTKLNNKVAFFQGESRFKYVLDFMYEGFDDETSEESDSSGSSGSSDDDEYTLSPQQKRLRLDEKYPMATWEVIIAKDDRGWSFSTIQQHHKKLSDKSEIARMRKYMQNNGSTRQKYKQLDNAVLNAFMEMRDELQEVHDRDLIDAALKAAADLGLETFKASEAWLRRFKKKYGIVSRKINAVVTKAQVNNQPELELIIDQFRESMKTVIAGHPLEKIFNADQTGIKQEMISGRTLTTKGEKKVKAVVRRVNATTHSYTVQVLINAAGQLILPAMVVFCEPKRPNCFESHLAPFTNIKAYSHPSGLMTSHLGNLWFEEVYLPAAGDNTDLMIDSWPGYNQAIESLGERIRTHILPPKSTSVAQPLDVYFNRPFKNFIRLLSCKIRRFHPSFDISNRVGMATIIDITLGQFAAPCFNPLIQYAWFKAGFFDERGEEFQTPVTVCFDSIKIDSKCDCEKRAFIFCAYCRTFFCFDHFVKDLHRCYA